MENDSFDDPNSKSVGIKKEFYSCDICNKTFAQIVSKNRHILKSHKDFKGFTCDQCGKWFTNSQNLIYHKQSSHEGNLKTYKCDLCEKTLTTKKSYRNHKKNIHETHRDDTCNECGRVFKTPMSLGRHMKIMHTLPTHKCDFCEKTFFDFKRLKNHTDRSHNHFMKCMVCHKDIDAKRLQLHYFEAHCTKSNEMYHCKICDKKFKEKSFKRHFKFAHGELKKSHRCELCDRDLSSLWKLKLHIKVNHNEKVFSCNQCEKTFGFEEALEQHIKRSHKTATAKRKIKCNQCDEYFTKIKDHISRVHEKS